MYGDIPFGTFDTKQEAEKLLAVIEGVVEMFGNISMAESPLYTSYITDGEFEYYSDGTKLKKYDF